MMFEETDISYSLAFELDHGVMMPLYFIAPRIDLPVIAIIINCLNAPLHGIRRC